MFLVESPPVAYSDPWQASREDRLESLLRGDRRVAYFYESPDSSTFRYRVYNMIQVLRGCGRDIAAAYFTSDDLAILDKIVDSADVLVFCRTRYTGQINRAITRARSKGKRVLFDIDDLVYDTRYVHLVLDTLDQDLNHPDVWDHWFAYVARLGAVLRLCDGVITTNEYLAEQIRGFGGKRVSVVPNFLNREQMEVSERIFEEKQSRGFKTNGQIHLGYFSGTPTHNKDLGTVAESLANLMRRDTRLVLRVVGFMDIPQRLRSLGSRIETYPLCDFLNLQREIGLVEVNLVPLQNNEFTNCKSELKYFEAGIVGTLTVASPVFTFAQSIRDGWNGFLAESHEWDEKIASLLRDFGSYPDLAQRAFVDCEDRFAWYKQARRLEDALFT